MNGNLHTILKSLYPDLNPRAIEQIVILIKTKLRNCTDMLSNVEVYNQPFLTSTGKQETTSITVFNRTVHIRLTFK